MAGYPVHRPTNPWHRHRLLRSEHPAERNNRTFGADSAWLMINAGVLLAGCRSSGSGCACIQHSGLAFSRKPRQPLRAVSACRLCTAARPIRQSVPVHLPACHQVCLRHGIWPIRPETPQLSVCGCPDILDAERRARRLLRSCIIESSQFTPRSRPPQIRPRLCGNAGRQPSSRRTRGRLHRPASPQALFQSAAYPDAVAAACASRKAWREQSSLAVAGTVRN
jgi:hypothetical protein